MKEATRGGKSNQLAHIRLTKDIHKMLRMRADDGDTTLQDWGAMAIRNELNRQDRKQLSRLRERGHAAD